MPEHKQSRQRKEKKEQETLRQFERKIVRRVQLVKEDDEWKIRNNQERDELLKHNRLGHH